MSETVNLKHYVIPCSILHIALFEVFRKQDCKVCWNQTAKT